MTRNEVLHVLAGLKAAFPAAYQKLDRVSGEAMVSLWLKELGGYGADQVQAAVDKFVAEETKGFPPSIGQIKANIPSGRELPLNGRDLAAWNKQREDLRQYAELLERRRNAGLPATWEDARRAGISAAEWCLMLDEAGLGVVGVL